MRLTSFRFASVSMIFLLLLTVGCKAQTNSDATQKSAAKSSIQAPVLARRIEILVRGQFNIPSDYTISIGARKPSNLPGYDTLSIAISKGTHTTSTDFLITTDNKSLARLETFDLTKLAAENIPIENRPMRGNPNAKVTVVNFDDLECPYCARMHQELFPETLDRYKDKVRFVYKDDPLTELHPWALHAAIDANCIADQNDKAYWGFVDYLHAHGQEVSGEDRNPQKSFAALDKIAADQGKIFSLDPTKLTACLQKQDEGAVRASMKEAESLGVEGTPYLFINGEHINGALPSDQVWAVIDRALRAEGVEPPPPASQPLPAPTLGR